MLRAVSAIYAESQVLEAFVLCRRDVFKLSHIQRYSSSAAVADKPTVLSSEARRNDVLHSAAGAGGGGGAGGGAPPPPAAPRPPPRRAWAAAATAAAALTASIGGVYLFRKRGEDAPGAPAAPPPPLPPAVPADGAALPKHAQFLLVGGGTASFAAMRAIRSARPDALVLMVGEEPHPPYMRPPLSKELWREEALGAAPPDELHALSFRQWNGKRRSLAYEPLAFYTPVEELGAAGGGAAVARGWRVARLDVENRRAELTAPGRDPVTLSYDECLVATGSRPRRLDALRAARDAGRALALRGARDAVRLARTLDDPATRHVVLVGGGFLASELSAALAQRLAAAGKRVTQVFREEAPLARVLPPYLAAEAARRLRRAGVRLLPGSEVVASSADGAGAVLRLRDGARLEADCVVECVGAEPALELARASGLEEHAALGGLLVTAELQARAGVWAAGDVACFYDVALGRRRVEHHDHAVVSGRLAGENMAGARPPRPYHHQSMFWSDLGPDLGYEAIGIIDSRLPTVGVFSATAVAEVTAALEAGAESAAVADAGAEAEVGVVVPGGSAVPAGATERSFERGVVFYTRENRVVGVLLWNLFNRMHIARQVLAQGEFEDLFEVAKLFSLHEED